MQKKKWVYFKHHKDFTCLKSEIIKRNNVGKKHSTQFLPNFMSHKSPVICLVRVQFQLVLAKVTFLDFYNLCSVTEQSRFMLCYF